MPREQRKRRKPVAATIQQLRHNIAVWLSAGVIAAIVDWLIGSTEQQQGIGRTMWVAIMFAAFIWAARQFDKSRKHQPTIRRIFYEGPGAFIKQLLIICFWIICLIPFVLGTGFMAYLTGSAVPVPNLEMIAGILIWLLSAAVSFFWIVRTIFAPVIALDEAPGSAIAQSWRLTKRGVLRLTGYVVGWLVLLLLPVLVIFNVAAVNDVSVFMIDLKAIGQGLIFVLVLPFMSVLIYQLYANASGQRSRQ
ncbi:hypothetical protein BRC21_02175 [Candidatus Saccharibacteria bacterium SW_7_54_9]|nr:MAG: hypothetical protein BRC21_02175 [Candidatus Saccharibacteria bacterium SW_7_54_9]